MEFMMGLALLAKEVFLGLLLLAGLFALLVSFVIPVMWTHPIITAIIVMVILGCFYRRG